MKILRTNKQYHDSATKPVIRAAKETDRASIQKFLTKRNIYLHRHLDWHTPLEWLGSSPYLLLEKEQRIEAILVCPPDINDIYWIRVFAAQSVSLMDTYFSTLFSQALDMIQTGSSKGIVASIGYLDWMRHILIQNGFSTYQQVVQLKWNPNLLDRSLPPAPAGIVIRRMRTEELNEVTSIDQTSFDRIWMHSLPVVKKAFQQSAYATVATFKKQIVGFQISTSYQNRAHIARLATLPQFQGRGIGTALVKDVLDHFNTLWMREITVNTQQDNEKSLRLYQRLGFYCLDERFPILIRQL